MEARKMTIFEQLLNEDGEVVSSGQNELGQEVPDPTPMALPLGMAHHATLADMISRMLRHQLMAQAAANEGFDTPEEGDDFDIEDDPLDPSTPYERHFEPPARTEVLTPTPSEATPPPANEYQQEDEDGPARSNEGRSDVADRRPGRARAERESEPSPRNDAADDRGLRETPARDPRAAPKDRRR